MSLRTSGRWTVMIILVPEDLTNKKVLEHVPPDSLYFYRGTDAFQLSKISTWQQILKVGFNSLLHKWMERHPVFTENRGAQ